MKKIKFLVLIVMTMTFCSNPIISFGQKKKVIKSSSEKLIVKEEEVYADCNETGNVITDPKIGLGMINEFRKYFCNEGSPDVMHALDQPVWLDLCLIKSIDKYLKENVGRIDGLRFYFGAYENPDIIAFPREKYQNRMIFMMIPTITVPAKGNISTHKDVDGEDIKLNSNCFPDFQCFNMESGLFNRMKEKFGSLYRGETTPGDHSTAAAGLDKYSVSVWFSACLFDVLVKIAEKPNNTDVDGYRFYPAAYEVYDTDLHPGQKYRSQSTILIVPTKLKEDAWDVEKKSLKKSARIGKTFNHGELCPDRCP